VTDLAGHLLSGRALRTYSQNRNTRLTAVARGVVDGTIRTGELQLSDQSEESPRRL